MKIIFLCSLLMSLSALAQVGTSTNVPSTMSGTEVYSNSGPTDANKDFSGLDSTPIEETSTLKKEIPQQRMEDHKTIKKVEKRIHP